MGSTVYSVLIIISFKCQKCPFPSKFGSSSIHPQSRVVCYIRLAEFASKLSECMAPSSESENFSQTHFYQQKFFQNCFSYEYVCNCTTNHIRFTRWISSIQPLGLNSHRWGEPLIQMMARVPTASYHAHCPTRLNSGLVSSSGDLSWGHGTG